MNQRLSETMKRMILEGRDTKTFFKNKKGQNYLRFDSMRIEHNKVCFYNGEVLVSIMDIPNRPSYATGETLTIQGLDAKIKIDIL